MIWLYFVCVDKVIYSSFNYWRIKHILLKWLIQTSHVQLFATPWTVACQVSLSLTISQSLPKLKSIALAIPSSHIILWYPLLLSIFFSIRDFSNLFMPWWHLEFNKSNFFTLFLHYSDMFPLNYLWKVIVHSFHYFKTNFCTIKKDEIAILKFFVILFGKTLST